MITFRVSLNGEELCSAGAEDLAVLTAMVMATGKLGPRTAEKGDSETDLQLRVGGLTSRADKADVHPQWVDHLDLEIGDFVTIGLEKAETADKPIRTTPHCGERANKQKKEKWEYAKAFYLQFREEFENEAS